MKRLALPIGLTLALAGCDFLMPQVPRVTAVNPEDGATDVDRTASVQATLDSLGKGVDLTTTGSSVTLSGPSGTVAAATSIVENTLTLDPNGLLAPNTRYTFSVTPELKTGEGKAFEAFTSTFTTGLPTVGELGSLSASPERLLFTSTGGSSDERTLTLTNEGDQTIRVSSLSVAGDDGSAFAVEGGSGFSLAPGDSQEVSVSFATSAVGPQLETLIIESDDPQSAQAGIALGGLALAGSGEASLQWIFDAADLAVQAGDTDPSSAGMSNAPLLGDEVTAPLFAKAPDADEVSAEVIAAFALPGDPVTTVGYYAAGLSTFRNALLNVVAPGASGAPANNSRRLQPDVTLEPAAELRDDGRIYFDPESDVFGFYSFWPTTSIYEERYVATEDRVNTFEGALPHHVRVYPLKRADGGLEPNSYVLATEEFGGDFDYNDVVVIIRGVVPAEQPPELPPGSGIAGLEIVNASGLPSNSRLVLSTIGDLTGNRCKPDEPCENPNEQPWLNLESYDTGELRLTNNSGSTLSLDVSSAQPTLFEVEQASLTLAPGSSGTVGVKFVVGASGRKGVYKGRIDVAAGAQRASFDVYGVYQPAPEAGNELSIRALVSNAFGYKVDLGPLTQAEVTSPKSGSEVRSFYWQAADPSQPVEVIQIAAYHSCCRITYEFKLLRPSDPTGSNAVMAPDRSYGQTIYPRSRDGSPYTELSITTSEQFRLDSADYWSEPRNGYLGLRTWPLVNSAGQTVPNTYLIAQDFVEGPCGTPNSGSDIITSNCDYNDNLYVISNVTPVSPY